MSEEPKLAQQTHYDPNKEDPNPEIYMHLDSAQWIALSTQERYEAVYTYLYQEDAFNSWTHPDGAPWGWNPDGTSAAPNPFLCEAHIVWFHDTKPDTD